MNEPERSSQLFMLRIWRATNGDTTEWRGKLQAVSGGEAYYFRNWEALVQHITCMLEKGEMALPLTFVAQSDE